MKEQIVGRADAVVLRCECRSFERRVLSTMDEATRHGIEQSMAEHTQAVELIIPMPQVVSAMTVQCPLCKTSGRYVREQTNPGE